MWLLGETPICTAAGKQSEVDLVCDGAGGAIITWQDGREGIYNYNIFAQRVDAIGVLLWDIDGVPVCRAEGGQGYPKVTLDGSGGAIVAWQDYRSLYSKWDVYAQRLSQDGLGLWVSDGISVCNAMDDQENLQIASDELGGAVIVWQDWRNRWLSRFDVYSQKVDSTGTRKWTPEGLPVCCAPHGQGECQLTTDQHGGVIVTWSDFRSNSTYDIYAARVWAEGSTLSWGTPFSGLISHDTIWSGVFLVTGDMVVQNGTLLTLSPGSVLRFAETDDWHSGIDQDKCELIVEGCLNADGCLSDPVILTSAAPNPTPNSWRGVRLRPASSENRFNNTRIEYTHNGVDAQETDVVVDSCVVSHAFNAGIKALGSSVAVAHDSIHLGTDGLRGVELGSSTIGIIDNTFILGCDNALRYGIELKTGASATIEHSTITGIKYGIRCIGADAQITETTIQNSSGNGIQCLQSASLLIRSTTIQDFTGTGCFTADLAETDLGTSADPGNNSIFCDQGPCYNVVNLTSNRLVAELNWWGSNPPEERKFYGDVDYEPWLNEPPDYALPGVLKEHQAAAGTPALLAYPNPLRGCVTIAGSIPAGGVRVRVAVYAVSGRLVRLLVDEPRPDPHFAVVWDGKDDQGDPVSNGVYLYEVSTSGITKRGKLVLLK